MVCRNRDGGRAAVAFVTRCILALCLLAARSYGAEQDDVVSVVERTFLAMKARDAGALKATMLPEARLYSERSGEVASRTLDQFVSQIVASKVELVERFTSKPQVMIRGNMAQVWGEYEFLRDGKFSHCGVDTVLLFKTTDGWRIATLSYTVEPTGCKGQ